MDLLDRESQTGRDTGAPHTGGKIKAYGGRAASLLLGWLSASVGCSISKTQESILTGSVPIQDIFVRHETPQLSLNGFDSCPPITFGEESIRTGSVN
jgi:hypothetical protein